MILQQFIEGLGLTVQPVDGPSPAAIEISDITDDSRAAKPGCLFIARGGTKADGRKFITDAIARGAVAVIQESGENAPPSGAPLHPSAIFLSAPKIDHAFVSALAERFFGHPGKKLKLIGVTGTNGKTTITFVIQHLLKHVGVKAGVIGTVLIDDGANRTPAELTTPGGVEFSRYLAAMVKNGCQAAIAEVSSHALHQGRLAGLDFSVAIFTNLTGDHLDYHHTMENYAAAKAILFENLRPDAWAVVNGGDAWTERMLRDCPARVLRCSINENHSSPQKLDCAATIHALNADHSVVRFDGCWGEVEVKLPLVGRHNVMNVLEALAAADCVTSVTRGLHESLENCPAPPGRLEPVRIESAGRQPSVLVDYAHTHDALENVLSALKPVTKGKLIVVFGCGGDRDRTKRPKMAAICCRLADRVIVTSDNPRTEDPAFIIGQVLTGVPEARRPVGFQTFAVEGVDPVEISKLAGSHLNGLQVVVQPDRGEAIAAAIAAAKPEDTVLIAGKGHEDYQIIGTTKRHFDDREVAAAALRAKK